MKDCDLVAERVALGDSLGELSAHVAECARCQRVVDMPGKLGATRHEVDPGLGFAARMTVGAQQRLSVRRRQRIVIGVGATVAVGALAVFLVARPAPEAATSEVATDTTRPTPEPVLDVQHDEDIKALVRFADTDRSSRLSADWDVIKQPLSPYRQLMRQVAVQVRREAKAQGVIP